MSSHLIRSDLVPIITGYLLLMAVLAAGLVAAHRRLRSGKTLTRHAGRRDRGWPALILHVVADALGGYLLLAAVVVLYYYLVARVGSNFLDSEFTGAAVLLGLAMPVFLVASWLIERRTGSLRRSKGRRNGQPGA